MGNTACGCTRSRNMIQEELHNNDKRNHFEKKSDHGNEHSNNYSVTSSSFYPTLVDFKKHSLATESLRMNLIESNESLKYNESSINPEVVQASTSNPTETAVPLSSHDRVEYTRKTASLFSPRNFSSHHPHHRVSMHKNPSFIMLPCNSESSLLPSDSFTTPMETYDPCCNFAYETIFRPVLTRHLHLSSDTILTMVHRHLLPPSPIVSTTERAQRFFHDFVYSENNLCLLADLMHSLLEDGVIANQECPASVVDVIYCTINLLLLILQVSQPQAHVDLVKYFASSVTLAYSEVPGEPESRQFTLSLQLSNFVIAAEFWPSFSDILCSFQCCRELGLSHCNMQYQQLIHVAACISEHVRRLDISSNPIGDSGLELLAKSAESLSGLRQLNLACCSLTGKGLSAFLVGCSDRLSRLRQLNVSYNDLAQLTASSFGGLLTEQKQQHGRACLQELSLQATNIAEQHILFEMLKDNFSLYNLDIGRNRLRSSPALPPHDLKYLVSGIAYNFTIRHLCLAMTGLTKLDCDTLNRALLVNKSLESLDLSDNPGISDEGVFLLADLFTMKRSLHQLQMRRCGLSVHAVHHCLRLVGQSGCRLRLLDLCYNRQTAPARHSVAQAEPAQAATQLWVKVRQLLSDIQRLKTIQILLYGTLEDYGDVLSHSSRILTPPPS